MSDYRVEREFRGIDIFIVSEKNRWVIAIENKIKINPDYLNKICSDDEKLLITSIIAVQSDVDRLLWEYTKLLMNE